MPTTSVALLVPTVHSGCNPSLRYSTSGSSAGRGPIQTEVWASLCPVLIGHHRGAAGPPEGLDQVQKRLARKVSPGQNSAHSGVGLDRQRSAPGEGCYLHLRGAGGCVSWGPPRGLQFPQSVQEGRILVKVCLCPEALSPHIQGAGLGGSRKLRMCRKALPSRSMK